jgi:hypothetical protein
MYNEQMDDAKKRLEIIIKKIHHLKNVDKDYKIFGAKDHKYEFGKLLEEEKIYDFENKYNVKIPCEYKLFMSQVGNGGAGPFYGIIPFEECLFSDIDFHKNSQLLNPSIPFPYTNAWNMEIESDNEEVINKFEKEYFDDKHITGIIRICNFGCGHFINLVVNGKEYSHIWSDDRASDYGIYPFGYYKMENNERLLFFDWYEYWLDKSIEEIKN